MRSVKGTYEYSVVIEVSGMGWDEMGWASYSTTGATRKKSVSHRIDLNN
jgi:hypothetical protein